MELVLSSLVEHHSISDGEYLEMLEKVTDDNLMFWNRFPKHFGKDTWITVSLSFETNLDDSQVAI